MISGGKAAVAALVETIESGTFGAASILGFVVLPDQLQVFADLTHHPDFHVRRAAIRVLGKSGDRVGPTTRPCVTDCITAICPNSGQPKPGSDPSFCAASFYAAGVVPRRSPRGCSPPTRAGSGRRTAIPRALDEVHQSLHLIACLGHALAALFDLDLHTRIFETQQLMDDTFDVLGLTVSSLKMRAGSTAPPCPGIDDCRQLVLYGRDLVGSFVE